MKKKANNRAGYLAKQMSNLSSKEIHEKNIKRFRKTGLGLFCQAIEQEDCVEESKDKFLYICGTEDTLKFLENRLLEGSKIYIYKDSSVMCGIKDINITLESNKSEVIGTIPDTHNNRPIQSGRPYFIDNKNKVYIFAVRDGVGNIIKLYTGFKSLYKEKIKDSIAIKVRVYNIGGK